MPVNPISIAKAASALLVLAAAALAPPARAIDGVLEIHQTCAVGAGCFAGDLPGLPVRIQTGGSYRLTSSLTVPDENTTAILIDSAVDAVTLDLNGFTIRGVTSCAGQPLVCTSTGPGVGVSGPAAHHVTVRNGHVVGLGSGGIELGDDARVEEVALSDNGGAGLVVGARGAVTLVRAIENGGTGIATGYSSRVSQSVAAANAGIGVDAGQGGVITGVSAGGNALAGISTGGGANVESSTALGNGGHGISTGPGSRVSACASIENSLAGVRTLAGSQVIGSLAAENGGFGLVLGPAATGYAGSVVEGNAGGTVSGGTETGSNVCDGVVSCP